VIRRFDIRDLSMVQRLQTQGRPLATQMAMVGGLHPLRAAMRSYVAGVAGAFDPVLCLVDADGPGAFGMLRMLPDESSEEVARQRGAALLLAAPMPRDEDGEQHWVSIVHELAAGAAERGAHHVVADVREGSFEATLLTAAGFAPQMQQDLLKLPRMQRVTQAGESVAGLRAAERRDEPLIRALHLRCAPRLTWAAESSLDALLGAMQVQRGYVLMNGSEVVGHVGFWHGGRGRAMRCLFRADHEPAAGAVLRQVLSGAAYRRATYCSVRSYQSWLAPVLQDIGFVHVSTNVAMLKHTAARVTSPVWARAPQGRRLLTIDECVLEHTAN
jgi:hypothetical protein